jgi:inner membrane protein
METENSTLSTLKKWLQESILIKSGLIGFLTIILLIPSALIQDLIKERQQRQQEVISEISDKWSTAQLLGGPVLVLPFRTHTKQIDSTKNEKIIEGKEQLYILPQDLVIKSNIDPEILHRGIFDNVVYQSEIMVNGSFSSEEMKKSGIEARDILWGEAQIIFGLSDLKGLKSSPLIMVNSKKYSAEPDYNHDLFKKTLTISPDLDTEWNTNINFQFGLSLKGSEKLSFFHLGKTTDVEVSGKWNNPSFDGRNLPDRRDISSKNFSAHWRMLGYNRPFPQQWIGNKYNFKDEKIIAESSFGVKLLLPVDQYQKAMRSSKYAVLIILLTFLSLFFTELIKKKRIHFFHYILIGAAMIIYYTLLLSFTEQVGFNLAYLISSIATIALITTFIASLVNDKMLSVLYAIILTVFYGFIFIIIQLQDLALLVGSIGLFIIIALLMYLSRRINWD